MYGPDSYLYETNLSLLATLSDDELADAVLVAQLTPGTTALVELGAWLAGACARGAAAVAAWFAPTAEQVERYRALPPLY